jgi:drug/metabolite transporter (DMT)-like permease
VVFAFAGIVALGTTYATGAILSDHSAEGYLWVLVATLLSQLIAHPAFNFVLGHLSPTFISIASQSIIVIAAILAFFLFHEVPGIGQVIGSTIILLGIVFAIKGQARETG